MSEYKVIWSFFAEKQLDDIFNYYCDNVSQKLAKKIVRQIILAPDKLKLHPQLGVIESLLINRNIEYRYIVSDKYKIIYTVDSVNFFIKIVNVFDTRQNPTSIENRVK